MKKIIAMLMALSLIFAFAACGDETSVEVNSLTDEEAFAKYAIAEQTEVGYKMNLSYSFKGVDKEIKYEVLKPADIQKIQYKYDDGAVVAGFDSEIIKGAKINLFYLNDGETKTATEVVSGNNDYKKYIVSNAVTADIFETIEMKLESEGNMTFTCTGVKEDFADVFGIAEYDAIDEDLAKVVYTYTIKNGKLADVVIKGSFAGEAFTGEAKDFEIIENSRASMKLDDADSYEKVIISDLDALAEQQEEAEAEAHEAATSEGAAGSGAE